MEVKETGSRPFVQIHHIRQWKICRAVIFTYKVFLLCTGGSQAVSVSPPWPAFSRCLYFFRATSSQIVILDSFHDVLRTFISYIYRQWFRQLADSWFFSTCSGTVLYPVWFLSSDWTDAIASPVIHQPRRLSRTVKAFHNWVWFQCSMTILVTFAGIQERRVWRDCGRG